jgi:hypothetical protein
MPVVFLSTSLYELPKAQYLMHILVMLILVMLIFSALMNFIMSFLGCSKTFIVSLRDISNLRCFGNQVFFGSKIVKKTGG